MKRNVLIIQERHLQQAMQHFRAQDGVESAGYLYCGRSHIEVDPWTGTSLDKYLVRSFDPILPADVVSSSAAHIAWKMDSFIHSLRRARENDEALAIIHNHPDGHDEFSEQDDQNEAHLISVAQRRNGASTKLVSIVLMPDGRIFGRIWINPRQTIPCELIMAVGARLRLHYPGRGGGMQPSFLDRQALALGPAFNGDLGQLRIGIVGCGGTGSAVAILLPRLGVKQIALFDQDKVDETNLNRLHLSTKLDAETATAKVIAVKRGIDLMGLGTEVCTFDGWINSPSSRDALKACDVIFGCTDDNAGRILLNRFAYFYNTLVIDMGLAIDVGRGDPPRVHAFDGRVTVIQPGSACLLCRGTVNMRQAQAESLKRTDPLEYDRQKAEAYVVGEGNPSPAVVTFTTAVAAMAVEELIHRLQGFRGSGGSVDQLLRRFHLISDRRQGEQPAEHCPVCASNEYWGRGDTDPFLDSSL